MYLNAAGFDNLFNLGQVYSRTSTPKFFIQV